jgi:hypothetical protein
MKSKPLRKSKKPDNKVVRYRKMMAEVSASKMTALKPHSTSLCPECLEELSIWLKNKNAHVQAPPLDDLAK